MASRLKRKSRTLIQKKYLFYSALVQFFLKKSHILCGFFSKRKIYCEDSVIFLLGAEVQRLSLLQFSLLAWLVFL